MAATGLGYRTVLSEMMEISLHTLQPILSTTLSAAVSAGSSVTLTIPSTDLLYPGALIVLDQGESTAEIVTVLSIVSASTTEFTATLTKSHALGASVQSATFPAHNATTDPLYTQAEILSYIARAQNDFLAQCPVIQAFGSQTLPYGTRISSLSGAISRVGGVEGYGYDAFGAGQGGQTSITSRATIEINRIAAPTDLSATVPITTLTRDDTYLVTAVSPAEHNFSAGQGFAVISSSNPSFLGSFSVNTIIDSYTWTYYQYPSNSGNFGIGSYAASDYTTPTVSTGGYCGVISRLYETSQEALSQQSPTWLSESVQSPSAWYEDRTGAYGFGIDGNLTTQLPVTILSSIRDTDTLGLLDGFLVPDPLLHYVKYRALYFIWSKNGEQRSPTLASYANLRYERGLMTVQRWMQAEGMKIAAGKTLAGIQTGQGGGQQ